MPRILIAPDKFKGTLSASQAARAIARGWAHGRPSDEIIQRPITDGGEGFGEIIGELMAARSNTVSTLDAAHRPCQAAWWWDAKTKTAIAESARVIGLAMLPRGKFHPYELDTFGLGKVLEAARDAGAEKIIVGLGGSATCDGGFGMARALGWRFVDQHDHLIERWTELHKLWVAYAPESSGFGEVIAAADVENTLLGVEGAMRTYGPQKGLQPDDLELAERCMGRLAQVMKQQNKRDAAEVAGSGAAGGVAFGLAAFLDARIEQGFELFAQWAGLDKQIKEVDLVVTGEGAIDKTTFMGKGVGRLASKCSETHVPCIALAGATDGADFSKQFETVRALTELTSVAEARSRAEFWLEQLAGTVAKSRRT